MNLNFSNNKKRLLEMAIDNDGHMLIKYHSGTRPMSRKARVAFVKQDCYQDLWIGNENETYLDLILSTQMRIGPIGLITQCKSKFFIVQFDQSHKGTDYFRHQSFISDHDVKLIKEYRAENTSGYLSSQSTKLHANYSQLVEQVDWSMFDVVICINSPFPRRLRKYYQDVLWACMPGEGLCGDPKLHNLNYDCYLTHNWASASVPHKGIYVDFPYTFLGADDLVSISHFTENSERQGIYLEINSGNKQERPPKLSSIPDAIMLHAKTGLTIKTHKGTIDSHLTDLITSKYFIKLGGRPTRGNAFMEAISAHTLILMSKDDCFGNMTLPEATYFENIDDLIQKILYFESNPIPYYLLLEKQKQCLVQYGIRFPLEQLAYVFNSKSKVSFVLIKELEHLRLVIGTLKNRFTQKLIKQLKIIFKSKAFYN